MVVGRWVRWETAGPPVWKGDPESDCGGDQRLPGSFRGFFQWEEAFLWVG